MDQILWTLLTQNNSQWAFYLSEELCDVNYQTNTNDFFSSMAIDVQWIFLTHKQLLLVY